MGRLRWTRERLRLISHMSQQTEELLFCHPDLWKIALFNGKIAWFNGKIAWFNGKIRINPLSVAIFNSDVSHHQRVSHPG